MQPLVKLKYCGGCNPRYDRVGLATRVLAALAEMDVAAPPDQVPLWLCVSGCARQCLEVPAGRCVHVSEDEAPEAVAKRVAQMLQQPGPAR